MVSALLFAVAIEACTCPAPVETAPQKVERLKREVREAELAAVAQRVNRQHERKVRK